MKFYRLYLEYENGESYVIFDSRETAIKWAEQNVTMWEEIKDAENDLWSLEIVTLITVGDL